VEGLDVPDESPQLQAKIDEAIRIVSGHVRELEIHILRSRAQGGDTTVLEIELNIAESIECDVHNCLAGKWPAFVGSEARRSKPPEPSACKPHH
jgi:hypothetical protein